VNQIVGAINSEFLTLKHTVELKDSKQETMSLDDKVSKRDGAKTIIEVFDSVKINLNSIKSIFTTMQKIINIDEKLLNLQPISFRKLLIEETKTLLKDNNQIALYYSFDKRMSNDIVSVDVDLFKEAIRNIITNAIKHSFSSIVSSFNSRKSIGFYLSVSPDKQNIVIDYMNNGDSLPEDFSFDDYVSYGKKFDSKDGSGLGGFITNKVIKKHNGSFINKLDNAQFEGSYNYTRTVDDYTSWSLTYDKLISLNDFYFPTTKNKKEDVLVEFEEYFSYEYDKYEENILISRDIKRGLKIDKIEIDIDALEALIDVNSFELEEFKRESSLNLKLNEFVSEDDLKLIKIQGTFSIDKKGLKYSDLYEIEFLDRLDDINATKNKIENLKAELVELNISKTKVEFELSNNLLETKNKIEALKVEIENMPDDEYDVIITKPNIHFRITIPINK
ncbi:MAG: hypothetical protein KAG14_02875, partial [Mycoplasmataceae bacterium]|nr:hypothetical protein [Mycoplasmataceae bacterium]